ncbi:hypothetical protein R3P38DRAFT_3346176 [Favolaschia claudopus]|uniref:Uncharacterized protein n=1 Tax=Favolaschia claudopus TaxID=2862362 RepID=A0AAW0D4D7_9AGAR
MGNSLKLLNVMLLPNHEILTLEGIHFKELCALSALRLSLGGIKIENQINLLLPYPPPSHLHFTAKNFPSSILCCYQVLFINAPTMRLTIRIAVRRAATSAPRRYLRRHDVATSGERDSLESFGRRQAKARPRSIKQRVPPLALLPPSSGRRAAALLRRHDVATSRERDFSCDVSPSGERTFWIFKYGNSFLASVSWGECCCRRKVNLNFNPRYFDVRRATSPPPIIFSFRCAALKTTTSSDSSSPQELNSSSAARHTRSIFSSAARCRLLQVPPKLPLSRPTQSIQYCPKRQISAANLQDPSPTTFDPSQRSKAAFKRLTSKLQDRANSDVTSNSPKTKSVDLACS